MRFAIGICAVLGCVAAGAADVEGSEDHPLISRYPGSEIQTYIVENYRPYKVPLGPVTGYRAIGEWIETESKAALDEIAKYLNAHGDQSFYVVGHTDAKGTLDYNQKLSSDRAKAVVAALVKDYGIDSARLEGHGVGPLAPVFANASDAGRDKNRRVELVER